MLVVVPFNKTPLFSKDLFIFIMSFISLFARVNPEPAIDAIHFLIVLPIKLRPASTKISLSIFLAPKLSDSFAMELTNGSIPLLNIISAGRLNKNPRDYILDKWVFENFILSNQQFSKSLIIFQTSASINNNLCGN